MATELGAEIIRKQGTDVARIVTETALEQECGLIIIGKPHFSFWNFVLNRNLLNKILKYSNDIDIVLVS